MKINDEKGSFTLEATLLFPLLFGIVVLLLWSALHTLQTSSTYISASDAADRLANRWDNSNKHPVTGMYTPLQYDPLYWRWSSEGADAWFGFAPWKRSIAAALPDDGGAAAAGLQYRKLSAVGGDWPAAYTGRSEFAVNGIMQSVSVTAGTPFHGPGLFGVNWGREVSGISEETVTQPTEYIRNIELLMTYIPVVVQTVGGKKIQDMLSPWLGTSGQAVGDDHPMAFRNSGESIKYLQALVRGSSEKIDTIKTGEWRKIDALDGQGVAHQEYLGRKSTNKKIIFQLQKDEELLSHGMVKGVVWHFFRKEGESSFGPTPALKRQLEQAGIVVVIHD